MCGDCYIAEISLDPEEFVEKRCLNCGFEDEEYGEAMMLSRRHCLQVESWYLQEILKFCSTTDELRDYG